MSRFLRNGTATIIRHRATSRCGVPLRSIVASDVTPVLLGQAYARAIVAAVPQDSMLLQLGDLPGNAVR